MITVIINVYNGEKYIKKCLDSIVNQTYKDLEILVINDGSTDNTLSICKSYKDKRIKIITTKNQGLSLSRNIGIDNANGKYLYFIDADDFIELDTIEYLYNLSKKYKTDITTCMTMDIVDYNYKVKQQEEKIEIIDQEEMLKKILLSKNRDVATWNKLIKKELFNNLRFENRIINDMAFTHKLVSRTNKILYSNQIKHFYLRHKESITGKKASTERLIDIYNVYYDRYNYIKDIYPSMLENNTVMLQIIVKMYLKNNKELEEYLNKQNALKIYKQIFTIKVLKTKISFREKIKLILFRVSPKLNKIIIKIYLKIKGVFK